MILSKVRKLAALVVISPTEINVDCVDVNSEWQLRLDASNYIHSRNIKIKY